jgi:TRAP-type C4-dicarboxylate transport system substrate-binding protein
MKDKRLLSLVICIILGLFIFSTSVFAQKIIKLKFADMCPPGSIVAKAGEWWASEVEKRTGGRVKVECFWGGSLVGAYEQLSSVKAGIIHVTPYYSGYHPDLAPLPLMGLFPMFNLGPLKEAMIASDEWYKTESAISLEFKKNNVKYLYPYNLANHYLWSKVPIKSLADLKGLRIRTFGPFLSFFKEFGCGLVSIPVPEVYTALERGAVDCTTQYLSNAVGGRYQEVVKYINITELGHNLGAPVVMNLDTWNSLPGDIQAIINKVNSEIIYKSAEIDSELYKNYMKTVKDSGMVIYQFHPTEVQKMIEIAKTKVWEPYAAKLEEKGIPATKALKHYIQLMEKYSKVGQ